MGNRQPWWRLELDRIFSCSGARQRDKYQPHHQHNISYGKHLGVQIALAALTAGSSLANTTVASPQATSSGSVTNNAYQMLTGPFPTYRMSQGIQCPGPTISVSPFITGGTSWATPYAKTTKVPVYSTADVNEDSEPDNPGKILYYSEIPRYEKHNHDLNIGVTATFTMPLDGGLSARCKRAVETNIKLQEQLLSTKRLEHELFRAKQCGELAKSGIQFTGRMSVVCSDLIVSVPPVKMVPHVHAISAPSAGSSDAQK